MVDWMDTGHYHQSVKTFVVKVFIAEETENVN